MLKIAAFSPIFPLISQRGENAAFSPAFPLAESIAKAFYWLSLWNFKEKSINHFLGHSLQESMTVFHDAAKNKSLNLSLFRLFSYLQ